MAFKPVNFAHLAKFNSATSSDFLALYEKALDEKIIARNAKPKHKTFAPSAFRCPRISWFRLRGVQPDIVKTPDRTMEFTADIGTACHEMIQELLSKALGDNWIDVEDYMRYANIPYTYNLTKTGYETQVEIEDPPIRFACDGIIRLNDTYYLLEIKSSEFSSWDELTDIKPQHADQIKCYGTLLNISNVIVMYIDRQYGGVKCYEKKVTTSDNKEVLDRIRYVQEMVECNLAPDRLPKGDSWCSSNHCPYFDKCKQWG